MLKTLIQLLSGDQRLKVARAICLPEIGSALLQHIVSWRKAILAEIFHQKTVEKLFYTYFI